MRPDRPDTAAAPSSFVDNTPSQLPYVSRPEDKDGARAGHPPLQDSEGPLSGLKPVSRIWTSPDGGVRIRPIRESGRRITFDPDTRVMGSPPSTEQKSFAPRGIDERPMDGNVYDEMDRCAYEMKLYVDDGEELEQEDWAENGAEAQDKDSPIGFLLAAWYGRTDRIEAAAEYRPIHTDEHWYALLVAVSRGHAATVETLLKIGGHADMDGWGMSGTLLIEAAQRGHRDVVRVLLDAGAEIERQNDDGDTALDLARAAHYDQVVEDIETEIDNIEWKAVGKKLNIDSLADLLEEKIRGEGALLFKKTPDWMSRQVVARFLERQKKRKAEGTFDPSMLSELLKRKGLLLVEALAPLWADGESAEKAVSRDADILHAYIDAEQPVPEMLRAMRFRQDVITEYLHRQDSEAAPYYAGLIACGMPLSQKPADVPIDVRDEKNLTPLMRVAFGGHIDLIEKLLDAGADVNAKYSSEDNGKTSVEADAKAAQGYTPLSIAASLGHVGAVLKMMPGADPENLMLALNMARVNNQRKAAKELERVISENIPTDMRDGQGFTPLMLIACGGDVDPIGKLLERDADVNAKDENGRTPLTIAASYGHVQAMLKLVPKADPQNIMRALNMARANGQRETAKELERIISADIPIDARIEQGFTPLMLIAAGGNVDLIGKLLERGADVNARAENGHTPLSIAAGRGDIPAVLKMMPKAHLNNVMLASHVAKINKQDEMAKGLDQIIARAQARQAPSAAAT